MFIHLQHLSKKTLQNLLEDEKDYLEEFRETYNETDYREQDIADADRRRLQKLEEKVQKIEEELNARE